MTFYLPLAADSPWGDYGDILFHGMSMFAPHIHGKIQLYRTGPFVPPITFPGISDIVITEELKNIIQSTWGILEFLPVEKAHIATLHWEGWDRAASDPLFYPANGEPEAYILNSPHDPLSAELMGNLWEVIVPESPTVSAPLDWVRILSKPGVYISERAKNILEDRLKDWVKFQPFIQS